MILEVDNVELNFSGKRILNGIYLKAETGKVTSILGSNGCGKSCLLQIIFGSLKPKYKLIRLNNEPFLKPLYRSKKISFLPQHHFVPDQIKIGMAFKLYQVDWDVFINKFPQFEIFKNTRFNRLSGGERRVIEIYLILKKASQIVLLDEPFNGVAPLYIETIQTIINQEKKHKIIILTDHRYTEVINVSDTIYLITNGCSKLINNLSELKDYKYLTQDISH
ncbi:ATP-binding cassette domain-containing protein [Hanstruepera flava]|uniref:ATP-binding cassette domain-containing protein n=1 Tax=Hanstruepera flava TaxID=2930218 RepID=UPI002027F530|nr:ABC transporter ATP-binding protein [Hanstruepera flava]